MKKTIVLRDMAACDQVVSVVSKLPAEPLHEVVIREHKSTRSVAQNSRLHAALGDIAKQLEWHGQKFSVHTWKRLTTAAYLREVGESPYLIPALDGAGVDIIYEKTSTMTVKTVAELIEWVYAFGSQNGVVFNDPADIVNCEER